MTLPDLIRWGWAKDRSASLIPLLVPAFVALLLGVAAILRGY